VNRWIVGEVGIASIELGHPVLCLSQVTDNRKFETTLRILTKSGSNHVVLFPCSHIKQQLYSVLCKVKSLDITTVKRRYFSEDEGMESVLKLSVSDLVSIGKVGKERV